MITTKTTTVSARISPETKKNAEKVLEKLGLTTTDAITMLFQQINLRQGIPFPVEIPNAETMKALEDGRKGIDLHEATSVEQLMEEIDK